MECESAMPGSHDMLYTILFVVAQSLRCVIFATPWTVASQVPLIIPVVLFCFVFCQFFLGTEFFSYLDSRLLHDCKVSYSHNDSVSANY